MIDAAAMGLTLADVRAKRPLVHNITNYVVMNTTANALLAVGASPAMVHAVEEAGAFAAIADALVVNIGTLSPAWVEAMRLAIAAAGRAGKPWVLDPVGAGATPYRTGVAEELLALRPAVLRGNASEIMALARTAVAATRGVDSTAASGDALDAARALARAHGCIVCVSGAVDYVTDGATVLGCANGHPAMLAVTGLGCTLSALTGACLAATPDPLRAALAAAVVLGIAGEQAAAESRGPGSLQVALLDRLAGLDASIVAAQARLT